MSTNDLNSFAAYDTFVAGEKYHEIDGWLDPGVFKTLRYLADFQERNNISGAVCEIGVHHGKFFIPLCLLRAGQERALVIDVFDDQKLNIDQSGRGDLKALQSNLVKHTNNRNICICKSDSMLLTADRIVQETDGQRIKLFSVDGSHSVNHTVNDITLAQNTIVPGGIIIVDDFFSQRWPEVMEGMHRFFLMSALRKVAPVAYGNNKLYLTTHSHREEYFKLLTEHCHSAIKKIEVSLWGHKVLFIRH